MNAPTSTIDVRAALELSVPWLERFRALVQSTYGVDLWPVTALSTHACLRLRRDVGHEQHRTLTMAGGRSPGADPREASVGGPRRIGARDRKGDILERWSGRRSPTHSRFVARGRHHSARTSDLVE
jgi:hypothetical protein